jgi:hypothetical protein
MTGAWPHSLATLLGHQAGHCRGWRTRVEFLYSRVRWPPTGLVGMKMPMPSRELIPLSTTDDQRHALDAMVLLTTATRSPRAC